MDVDDKYAFGYDAGMGTDPHPICKLHPSDNLSLESVSVSSCELPLGVESRVQSGQQPPHPPCSGGSVASFEPYGPIMVTSDLNTRSAVLPDVKVQFCEDLAKSGPLVLKSEFAGVDPGEDFDVDISSHGNPSKNTVYFSRVQRY